MTRKNNQENGRFNAIVVNLDDRGNTYKYASLSLPENVGKFMDSNGDIYTHVAKVAKTGRIIRSAMYDRESPVQLEINLKNVPGIREKYCLDELFSGVLPSDMDSVEAVYFDERGLFVKESYILSASRLESLAFDVNELMNPADVQDAQLRFAQYSDGKPTKGSLTSPRGKCLGPRKKSGALQLA